MLIVTSQYFGITDSINEILQNTLNWIDNLGTVGIFAFILIYIIATILLISGAVLTLGAGFIFGVVRGSMIVSLASVLGATAAFLIGRYVARGWVAKQIERQPKFKAIDNAVAREGWKIVGLTRLSPIFPFVFLNYAFGVTQVSLRDYMLASWIGMLPGTIMYVYLGYLPKIAATGSGDFLKLILNIVGLIATVTVTIYVTKIAKQALDSQIAHNHSNTKINSESINDNEI
ncbi:SNARE associated Golgi protein [Stanieria sp. NIES-3757]|nr:SNARE associated Golgi protein [Stanieria sp. NIES-3757]